MQRESRPFKAHAKKKKNPDSRSLASVAKDTIATIDIPTESKLESETVTKEIIDPWNHSFRVSSKHLLSINNLVISIYTRQIRRRLYSSKAAPRINTAKRINAICVVSNLYNDIKSHFSNLNTFRI